MVKNVVPVIWKGKKLKEGTTLTDDAVKFFKENSPEILNNMIQMGSDWIDITTLSKKFIEENKTKIKKIGDYFGIKKEKIKEEEPTRMLRVHPKPIKPKRVLDLKDKTLTELKKIARKLKIPQAYKLKENQLIKKILEKEE